MKTKVNEVPLVGPKGRKELLRRINELEAQVAQQDYIQIEISGQGSLKTEFSQEKATELNKRGVLSDVLLKIGYGMGKKIHSKILGFVVDDAGKVESFQYAAEDHIELVEYD